MKKKAEENNTKKKSRTERRLFNSILQLRLTTVHWMCKGMRKIKMHYVHEQTLPWWMWPSHTASICKLLKEATIHQGLLSCNNLSYLKRLPSNSSLSPLSVRGQIFFLHIRQPEQHTVLDLMQKIWKYRELNSGPSYYATLPALTLLFWHRVLLNCWLPRLGSNAQFSCLSLSEYCSYRPRTMPTHFCLLSSLTLEIHKNIKLFFSLDIMVGFFKMKIGFYVNI